MTDGAGGRKIIDKVRRHSEAAPHLPLRVYDRKDVLVLADAAERSLALAPGDAVAHDLCVELDQALHGYSSARPYSPAQRWRELLLEVAVLAARREKEA